MDDVVDCSSYVVSRHNQCESSDKTSCSERPSGLECRWCGVRKGATMCSEDIPYQCSFYSPLVNASTGRCRVRGVCIKGQHYEAVLTNGCASAACGGTSATECERRIGEGRIAIKGFSDLRGFRATADFQQAITNDLRSSLETNIAVLSMSTQVTRSPHLLYVYFNVSDADASVQRIVTYYFIQQRLSLTRASAHFGTLFKLQIKYEDSSAPWFGPPPETPSPDSPPGMSRL